MKLDRKEILKALETITISGEGKNMVESGAVANVITFGDEVVVDLVLHTPAMHIKKRAEDDVKKTIHELVSADAKIKVNIKSIIFLFFAIDPTCLFIKFWATTKK